MSSLGVAWLIAVLMWVAPAWAQDAGFYVGGSFGQATYRGKCPAPTANAPCNDDDNAWRLFAGYQFNRYVSLELGFADLGRTSVGGIPGPSGISFFSSRTIETEITAWDLAVIAALPFGERLSLLGRVGLYWADLERREITTTRSRSPIFGIGPPTETVRTESMNESGATLGLGVRFDFARYLSVRLEWLAYMSVRDETLRGVSNEIKTNDIHVLSAGLLYRF